MSWPRPLSLRRRSGREAFLLFELYECTMPDETATLILTIDMLTIVTFLLHFDIVNFGNSNAGQHLLDGSEFELL